MSNVATLPPKDREKAIEALLPLLRLWQLGKPINVKWGIAKPDRTKPQCRYLNGVAYKLLSDHTGYEKHEISEYMCGMYFGWREKKLPGGRTQEVPIRTTTTDENGDRDVLEGRAFWDYVEWIQRVGARQGIVIPDPDPDYKIKRGEK